jgi:hypothetical protein
MMAHTCVFRKLRCEHDRAVPDATQKSMQKKQNKGVMDSPASGSGLKKPY